jgi:MFS family permease
MVDLLGFCHARVRRPCLRRRAWGVNVGRLAYGLSRELWLVQIGIFLNTFGWGAVLPFEVIYLHDGRGFSLSVAGLIVGTLTGVAVLAAPLAGPVIDRFGARATAVGAGVALAAGYAGLAFAHSPAVAFAAAALGGAGNGALNPAQSTLLATLAPADLRHRATAVSRVCTNAGFGIGGALGGLVASFGLTGFMALFLLNAATYLAYVVVLASVVPAAPAAEQVTGGYRRVLGDGAFLHLALTNVAVIAVGWGVLPWVVPPYAKNEIGVDARLIGLLMLANAATVVLAQVPVTRLAEGRRRVVMMATGSSIFGATCLLFLLAGSLGGASYLALVVAAIAIGIGECFHSAALMPLVADLAPPSLRGRYMATIGLSFWIGLALAPTIGTQLLTISATVTFAACAATAAAAACSVVTLERRLPDTARLTPLPATATRLVLSRALYRRSKA